jgi:hypothetical protein
MRAMEHVAEDAAPARPPVPALHYAPVTDRKPRLNTAATVTLIVCGSLLVIAPMVAVVWACSATYYNDSARAIAPYALASAAAGILMVIAAISRGARQRDAMS